MAASISIRLPENTARALEEIAKATDRANSYLILKALDRIEKEN